MGLKQPPAEVVAQRFGALPSVNDCKVFLVTYPATIGLTLAILLRGV